MVHDGRPPGGRAGPAALIDDDLANVSPWGFDPADIAAPVLIVHGGADRVIPSATPTGSPTAAPRELRLYPDDGHISVSTPPPRRWSGCAERFREGPGTDVVPDASQNSGAGDYPVVVFSVGTEVAVGALVADGVVVAVGSLVSDGSLFFFFFFSCLSDGSLESVGSVHLGHGGVGSMTA